MILLNKKRVILFVFIIFLAIIFYFIYSNKSVIKRTVDVSNINLNTKVIIVDAGHGAPDYGAQSKSGVSESNLNLKISLKLKEKLEQNNYTVILTRKDEEGIYDSTARTIREMKNSDLKNRVKIANTSNADAFVSIHLNKIDATQYWGWQTFFKRNNESGKKLAESIQIGISTTIGRENKRKALSISNKYLIDNVKIPTVIVECGFLSNEEETKLLQEDEYQKKLVEGIYCGIDKYFNVEKMNT